MTGEEGLEREGMFSSCCGCRQMAPGVCASGFAHPTHRTRMGPGKRAGDTELTGNDLPPAQLRAYCSLFWAALSGSFLQERSLEVVPPPHIHVLLAGNSCACSCGSCNNTLLLCLFSSAPGSNACAIRKDWCKERG